MSEEARAVYLRFREVFGGRSRSRSRRRREDSEASGRSAPFDAGRDPHGLGEVLTALTGALGWTSPLAQSELVASWPRIVGADTAAHSVPVAVGEGRLVVRCDSTAWATQLRLMRTTIVTRIAEEFPDAGVETVQFDGPDVPSWKRGLRAVQGRGPRDTYG
ncbi:MAG: DciA family protein [Microbacteriaceae bacterium]